jgi:hypothetical protein
MIRKTCSQAPITERKHHYKRSITGHRTNKDHPSSYARRRISGVVRYSPNNKQHFQSLAMSSLTPIFTVVGACDRFLDDESLASHAVECLADKEIFLSFPEYANRRVTKRACTVWDPLFKVMHSKNSGLEEAIREVQLACLLWYY